MPIRVFIQTKFFEGGPAVFRSRIIPLLNASSYTEVVTDVNKKFDIELAFIRKVYSHNKPHILRADGCYYEEGRGQGNKNIREAMLSAKHIIFQSKSSFELCDHVLGIRPKIEKRNISYSIVYNGINLEHIDSIEPDKEIAPGSFITCAGWRPNKRPISTIKGFLEANIKRHLYIIGGKGFVGSSIGKKYNSKYIHILNDMPNKKVLSMMKACDYQLHLCHIDSCPNAIIEGLSCGLNVLCTNLGGTRELVGNDGVVLEVDDFWDSKYLKKQDIDELNPSVVAEGIHKLLKIKTRPDRPDLDINKTFEKYVDIIRKSV